MISRNVKRESSSDRKTSEHHTSNSPRLHTRPLISGVLHRLAFSFSGVLCFTSARNVWTRNLAVMLVVLPKECQRGQRPGSVKFQSPFVPELLTKSKKSNLDVYTKAFRFGTPRSSLATPCELP